MDSDSKSSPDFGFGFNDIKFSDRVLRLEVLADDNALHDLPLQPEDCRTNLNDDCATRKTKRCRVDVVNNDKYIGDEEAAASCDDSNLPEDDSIVLRVKTLHINSLILAEKRPFFYKLFSNGMMESEQRHVTLRISASEEAAVMMLLNFMYSGTLRFTTPCQLHSYSSSILDVLMAADKFEVVSCARYCIRLLTNLPMTLESALLYLDIPSSVLMTHVVQPLIDASKLYLVTRYKDISACEDEVMNLPLAGIEAILSNDDLQVFSEDVLYDFVLKWARTHYQDLDERRNILSTHLGPHIRFSHMSYEKLQLIQTCNDFNHEFLSKSMLEALFFKAAAPHHQRILAATKTRQYKERTYMCRPIKVVELELPRQHCVVYFDLKREDCMKLFPSGRVESQPFQIGEHGFFQLVARSSRSSFFVILLMRTQHKDFVTFAVDYEFTSRLKPTQEYSINTKKGNHTFTREKASSWCKFMFSISWSTFVAENSPYFINGMFHMKTELMIKS